MPWLDLPVAITLDGRIERSVLARRNRDLATRLTASLRSQARAMRLTRLLVALALLGSALVAAEGLATSGESDYARLLRKIRAARHARRLRRRQGSSPSMSSSSSSIIVRRNVQQSSRADLAGIAIQDLPAIPQPRPRLLHAHPALCSDADGIRSDLRDRRRRVGKRM